MCMLKGTPPAHRNEQFSTFLCKSGVVKVLILFIHFSKSLSVVVVVFVFVMVSLSLSTV